MAQHAILRFEKHKGNPARPLEAHHERQKEQYASNPDIDTSRSKYNFHIVKPEGRYYHFIQNRIEQAGCRTRKDSTRFVDTLITASPEFFKKKSPKEIQAFFQRAADFLIGRVGRENIVSAVVHMDEKTPHLHLVFVPLTEDNRLCAKEIIGNRASLTKWQDDFHAYMVEKYPDLERGESASKTGRKHIPTRLFKQAVNLSKQARAIEATLDGITPFNAGKKKEEALSLLKKWFPQMENFSGQLKKYKVTINDLLSVYRLSGTISTISSIRQSSAAQIFTSISVVTCPFRPILVTDAGLIPALSHRSFFFMSLSMSNFQSFL